MKWLHNPWKTRPEPDLENTEAPEKPLPNVPLEDVDTSETADLTRDKAEEKNEETIRQVESTEIQNHEKGNLMKLYQNFNKTGFYFYQIKSVMFSSNFEKKIL